MGMIVGQRLYGRSPSRRQYANSVWNLNQSKPTVSFYVVMSGVRGAINIIYFLNEEFFKLKKRKYQHSLQFWFILFINFYCYFFIYTSWLHAHPGYKVITFLPKNRLHWEHLQANVSKCRKWSVIDRKW